MSLYAGGSPAQALAEVQRQAQSEPLDEATMRVIAGLLKMAHDLQLPPTCLQASVQVRSEVGNYGGRWVEVTINGNVQGVSR